MDSALGRHLNLDAISAQASTVPSRTDRWLALVTAVERLSAAESIDDIIQVVRETARTISGADGVTFVLRDGNLCHYVEEDAVGPLWKGRRFPMSACISGWCMLNGKMAIIPDIYVDPRIPHDAYRPTFVKSLVMVPVRAENPLAAIGSYWSTCREFSDGEIGLLEGLGRSTAAAIAAVQARNTLRDNEERLRLALAAGGLGAWELNLATGTFTASAASKAHFGRGAEDPFSYQDFVQAIHPDDLRHQHKAFEEARDARSDLSIEVRIVWPNGDIHWIEMRGQVFCDANAGPSRLTGVSLDITDRKRAEAAHRAKEAAERAAQTKSRVLAAVGHDLKQPLQIIAMVLSRLERQLTSPDQQQLLSRAGRSIDKLAAALDMLLEVARLESGVVEPRIEAFPIQRILDEIEDQLGVLAGHKGLSFQVVPSAERVRSDPKMLATILHNLVGNAIKYTERGGVVVSCQRRRGLLSIEVRDTGIGIPPEKFELVFDEFQCLGISTNEGLGLGLAIVRRTAEALGHRLGIQSSVGEGSVFSIDVPLDAIGPAEAAALSDPIKSNDPSNENLSMGSNLSPWAPGFGHRSTAPRPTT